MQGEENLATYRFNTGVAPGVAHSGKEMAPFAVRELGL